jgi:hypothetical protein
MSFASKAVSAGVAAKALLMGALVSLLGATTFADSIVLVLVSATATGVFGIIIVLIQTHSDAAVHRRLDELQARAETAATASSEAAGQARAIAVATGAELTPQAEESSK